MKSIVLNKPEQLSLTEIPSSRQPLAHEALVRVRRVGICGSDLHAFKGEQPFLSYPRILGHELGVEVVALGRSDQQASLAVGDRCCLNPYLNCGVCGACRRGTTNCCVNLKVLGVHIDGGMREQLAVPTDKLRSSGRLSLEQLAL